MQFPADKTGFVNVINISTPKTLSRKGKGGNNEAGRERVSMSQRSRVLARAVSQLFQHQGDLGWQEETPEAGKRAPPKLARETRGWVRRKGHTASPSGMAGEPDGGRAHLGPGTEAAVGGLARAPRQRETQRSSPRGVRRPQASPARPPHARPRSCPAAEGPLKNRSPRPGRH